MILARKITLFFSVVLAVVLGGCSSNTPESGLLPNTVVLPYKAFGPGEDTLPLLGVYHWQWPDPDNRPRRPMQYDIKVVVYRGVSLQNIQLQFPVLPEKKQDYRYLEYETAISFLDQRIKDLNAEISIPSRFEETEEDRLSNMIFLQRIIISLYKTTLEIEQGILN